jgi:hypothetical protein
LKDVLSVFCAKSRESLEKKRVEFSVTARKRKRVRNSMSGKGIDRERAGTSAALNVRTSGGPPFLQEFKNKGVAEWAPVSERNERGDFL